ncbi:uncharacterized protein EMH_0045470 [Eimeria mitis]|uniref:Uncharacterized protein n=1 Tax=Eimeria mitis TaxID=44415 RepID=U6K4B1_9EIME|nr:uncharacterized protein EMH_0045470 [Eimeria mitis]CDJ32519.1 hypothetical protein, conserved [Eimeria mitis]
MANHSARDVRCGHSSHSFYGTAEAEERGAYGNGGASGMAHRRQAGSGWTRETPEGFDLEEDCLYLEQEYGSGLLGSLFELGIGPESAREELLAVLNQTTATFEPDAEPWQLVLPSHCNCLEAASIEGICEYGHATGLRCLRESVVLKMLRLFSLFETLN